MVDCQICLPLTKNKDTSRALSLAYLRAIGLARR
jgi:hypothetical protein